MSKPYDFVKLAWDNESVDSWGEHNHCVAEAVRLAVRLFIWTPEDIKAVLGISNRRAGVPHCLGEGGVERLYTIAVTHNRYSFCCAYESYVNRQPLILDNVRVDSRSGPRAKSRICVGARFKWYEHEVEVTSFNAEGCAIAVCYEVKTPPEDCVWCGNQTHSGENRIKRRFAIDRAGVIAERNKRKENIALAAQWREELQATEAADVQD